MSLYTYTPQNDGTLANVADINTPFQAITTLLNGNLDSTNLAAGSVTADRLASSANPETRQRRNFTNYVVSGLTIATSGTLSSTITTGYAYVNGKEINPNAFPKTFRASEDTYVDLKDDGTYVFVEVANNAFTGMTLTLNSDGSKALRIARVITSTTAVVQVMQASHVSSGFVAPNTLGHFGFDAIGNAVYNTDPTGLTLGYAELTSSFSTTSTSLVDAGLTITVQVPAGRRIAISAKSNVIVGTTGGYALLALLEDGTQIDEASPQSSATNQQLAPSLIVKRTPTAGSHTYKIQTRQTAVSGGITLSASTSTRPVLTIELA